MARDGGRSRCWSKSCPSHHLAGRYRKQRDETPPGTISVENTHESGLFTALLGAGVEGGGTEEEDEEPPLLPPLLPPLEGVSPLEGLLAGVGLELPAGVLDAGLFSAGEEAGLSEEVVVGLLAGVLELSSRFPKILFWAPSVKPHSLKINVRMCYRLRELGKGAHSR